MKTILTIVQNPTEGQWFAALFQKAGIRSVTAMPSYASYTKTLQYEPAAVIMEVPANPLYYIQFLTACRRNKLIQNTKFILYGPNFDNDIISKFKGLGVSAYMRRPLDIKKIISTIQGHETPESIAEVKQTFQDTNQLSKDAIITLFSKDTTTGEKLDLMVAHVGKLMVFPATVANILRVTQDDKSGAADLAKVIKSDPAVSTEVLKVANSVHFASRNKRIMDVKDAIIRVGFAQTKNIAMSLSVFKVMKDRNYETGFSHTEYWFHCLGVALLAEKIARRTRMVLPEEAFIAGLLHDLGILLYNEYFNEIFLWFLEKTTDEGVPFISFEFDKLGLSHNDLVARLFAKWQFPEGLVRFITNLYNPQVLTEEFAAENPLPVFVNAAEVFAKSLQIGREVDCCVHPVPNWLLKKIGCAYGLQRSFVDEVYNEMNMFNSFLNIDNRAFPVSHDIIENAERVKLLSLTFTGELYNPIVEYLRSQNYTVTFSNDVASAEEACLQNNAVVVCDAGDAVEAQVKDLAARHVLPFKNEPAAPTDANTAVETVPARLLVFDHDGNLKAGDFDVPAIVSNYPVDLRNVDLVLANLLLETPMTEITNQIGSLRRVQGQTLDGEDSQAVQVLIVHSNKALRDRLAQDFKDFGIADVELTNDGPTAVNLARTRADEIDLFVIDMNVPRIKCPDLIERIKMLPGHKRARFLVTFVSATREDLLPIARLGVKNFIAEDSGLKEFADKLKEMGILPKR